LAGVVLLVALLSFYGGEYIHLRSTGAFDAAVRAARANGMDGEWQTFPYLSIPFTLRAGDHTYMRIRLFDRQSSFRRTTDVIIMRASDAPWVPEGHPLYIPNDHI